jgi:23S rRNA (uracil1939-C5)-methyltransferase
MYKKGDIINVKIENLAFGGPGVARLINGEKRLAVFIEGVAPGDLVEAEIFMLKRNLAKARVKKFLEPAGNRIKSRCPHFGLPVNEKLETLPLTSEGKLNTKVNCGGCTWQFLSYEDQLKVKFQEVRDSLLRLGGVPVELVDACLKPVLGMSAPWYYRNKMEFSFCPDREGKLAFGLHMKGRFYDVTEIEECYLFRPWVGEFVKMIRGWLAGFQVPDEMRLESVVVRCGSNTGEVMVNLIVENGVVNFAKEWEKLVGDFFESGAAGKDRLVSLFLTQIINKKGQRKEFYENLIFGKPAFTEKLRLKDGQILTFEVHPEAFLQPNTSQAELFYSMIGELAALQGKEKVFDLFCGTGTIGLSLAAKAGQVFGIELNASAIENARRNAELNQVGKVEFKVGDVNKILPEMAKEVDLIVVDPPRAGLNEEIIESINQTSCRKVIYVSCNPTTLARDLKSFLNKGFKLELVQPIDQFCQTYHVEAVTLLTRG